MGLRRGTRATRGKNIGRAQAGGLRHKTAKKGGCDVGPEEGYRRRSERDGRWGTSPIAERATQDVGLPASGCCR